MDFVANVADYGDALAGGSGNDNRKTVALTTSLRNVGVGLVIVVGNFAGTPAVSAVLAVCYEARDGLRAAP